ncbi:MAG: hypothetical protein HOP28_01890 [Gemmatimonadales bacterium]|nr:hypothetical protein [Gemmatimonadales bacterium]
MSDKRELLDAFDQVVERDRKLRTSGPVVAAVRRNKVWIGALCVVLWGWLAYTWLSKPAWLFQQDPASLMSVAEQENAMRFGLYLQRERVAEYVTANRRLPAALEDAGDVEQGVTYLPGSGTTFTLVGSVAGVELRLASGDSAEEFLKPTGIKPNKGS